MFYSYSFYFIVLIIVDSRSIYCSYQKRCSISVYMSSPMLERLCNHSGVITKKLLKHHQEGTMEGMLG